MHLIHRGQYCRGKRRNRRTHAKCNDHNHGQHLSPIARARINSQRDQESRRNDQRTDRQGHPRPDSAGERSRDALLDEAWSDVPAEMREAAAMVMDAHLDKLKAEGRLPPDLTP